MSFKVAKWLIGATATLLPLASGAQDLTPDASRILSDPNYLPVQGQIWGYTNYFHTWSNGSNLNSLGNQTSEFHIDTNELNQFLGYGITDDLMIDASMAYEPGASRNIRFANGSTSTLNSSGLSDPTFGVTYRLLDQLVSPVTFDLFGSYMPDWISSKIATTTSGGSLANGGQEGEIGAALAEETRFLTVRGDFAVDFLGRRDIDDVATGDTFERGGHTNYTLSLTTQTRLSGQFSVNAGVRHTFQSSSSYTDSLKNLTSTLHPGDNTVLDLALNYQFIPDTVVGSVIYRHGLTGDTSRTFPTPAADVLTSDQYSNLIGVQLDYAIH
jgi:hypothetical protein